MRAISSFNELEFHCSAQISSWVLLISSPPLSTKLQYPPLDSIYIPRKSVKLFQMPSSSFSGTLRSPKLSVAVDMGHPFLNHTVDGFLKIGAVGVAKSLAEDTYKAIDKGRVSKNTIEHALKKMCKEGVYWGSVAGVYVGTEYGIERIRGTRDWKNAMLAGAVTGAVISAASNKGKDKVVVDAITGGALATASQFLNYHYFY